MLHSSFIVSLKAVIILVVMFFATSASGQTQPSQAKPKQNANTDKVIGDTTIRSSKYQIYVGSRGGKYIIRTKKDSTTYKQYIK